MPSYKLIYFDSRARGEVARLLFALAGVEYQDVRIEYGSEEWLKMKPTTPLGQLPILEADGQQLVQSKAIFRYLAKEFGFYGETNWDGALIDTIMDTCEQLHTGVVPILRAEGEEKAKLQQKYRDETMPPILKGLEGLLRKENRYFAGEKARGETACILFKLAGVAFKDDRISDKEWPEFKATTPFRSLPILEEDGKQLTQSRAIYRYLASEFGFYGDNSWQCAEIDCVLDMLEDLVADSNLGTLLGGPEEDKPMAMAQYTENVKKVLGNLEKKLRENDEGDGYFVGLKMTVADVHFYNHYDFVAALTGKGVFKDFPRLSGLRRRVGQNKKISAWVEKRPVTFC